MKRTRSPEGCQACCLMPKTLLGTALFLLVTSPVTAGPLRGVESAEHPQRRERTPSNHPGLKWASRMPVEIINRTTSSMVDLYCGVQPRERSKNWYQHNIKLSWYKNGRKVVGNRRMRMAGYYLKIADLKLSDSGNYTCVVQFNRSQLQWQFFLRVQYTASHAPVLLEGPKNQTVTAGSRVVFKCNPLPDMPMVRMIWVKHNLINGTWGEGPLGHGDPHITILKDWSLNHSQLVLNNVQDEDSGWYTCALKNMIGEEQESAYLDVTAWDRTLSANASTGTSKQKDKASFMQSYILIIGSVLGIVVIFIITVVSVTVFCYKKRKLQMKQYQLYHRPSPGFSIDMLASQPLVKQRRISSRSSTSSYPSVTSASSRLIVPVDEAFEFPRNRLTLQETIGEGEFGIVKKAIAYGIGRVPKATLVAVKTIKDDASYDEQCDFMKEAEVMKTVKKMGSHINIINFLGCCTQGGPQFVIVEYAKKGNLRNYLMSFRSRENSLVTWRQDLELYMLQSGNVDGSYDKESLSQRMLLGFSHQVARGMEFLASHKCIHRDLAARNVLVTEDNILKIADFGLARNGIYYRKKSRGQLPVKWMPPEALLDMKYTEKSDVWSFGVLLWEVFTLGGMPYPTIPPEDLYHKLMEGHRMERPPFAPHSLYDTMKRCWCHLPEDRPDFSLLVMILERHLVRVANGGYIEVLPSDES